MGVFKSSEGKGGKRPGSGRKPLPPGEKKEPLEVWAKPSVLAEFKRRADQLALSPGDYLELLLD